MKKLTREEVMELKDKEALRSQFEANKKAYKKAQDSLQYAQDVLEEEAAQEKMNIARANVKLIKEFMET